MTDAALKRLAEMKQNVLAKRDSLRQQIKEIKAVYGVIRDFVSNRGSNVAD